MRDLAVFLHVGSVLAFMLAHGVHVSAMWAMRSEPDPERMLTFFNIVPRTDLLRILLAAVVLTGAAGAFIGEYWSSGWVWASLVLLAGISFAMWRYGGGYFGLVSRAAEAAVAARAADPPDPAPGQAYEAARRAPHPLAMGLIGLGGIAAILWLMVSKPF